MKSNYLNLVGLAIRARKCSVGEENIVKDIQKNRAKLVLLANDIGAQTKKKLTDKCNYYGVPFAIITEDREALSQAIGKSKRVAVAILDAGFAAKIKSLLG
ncbi:L7Ae/L30e/S12e/Gadd45 family ribosomal protein [Virgibacillus sp. W0430]|uniref:L7Ae/L30e/S12e/Gadd45 family ribosomal protein n=1 Tax=Virgibacillus sp. W0430 TaxID=3391580 RepID=UPI003F470203